MSKRAILTLCAALALGANGFAQPQQPAPKPPAEEPAPPHRPEAPGQPVNVRVDLTITDHVVTGEPLKKTITMLAADRVRSSVRNEVPNRGFLNADVHPVILPSGSIRLTLGLEYMPTVQGSGTEGARTLSRLNEQITVVLEPGKPLVVSQAADPTSERKVAIQLTATVAK